MRLSPFCFGLEEWQGRGKQDERVRGVSVALAAAHPAVVRRPVCAGR